MLSRRPPQNIYSRIFLVFLLTVVVVVIGFRPKDDPRNRIITEEGFGFYACLPAIFIHQDYKLEYHWFKQVYEQHYERLPAQSAEDVFPLSDEKPVEPRPTGLAFIWVPFFLTAHLIAGMFNLGADGFSQPYQWAILLASTAYLLLGLIYFRRLLYLMGFDDFATTLTTVAFFFGSFLFQAALHGNSLPPVYSFTFINGFVYHVCRYFQQSPNRQYSLLTAVFLYFLCIAIEPLNAIVLLVIPAFYHRSFFATEFKIAAVRTLLPILSVLLLAGWTMSIDYVQTGHIFPKLLSSEMHFSSRSFFGALTNNDFGLLVCCPLFLVSFGGAPLLPIRQKITFVLLFLGLIAVFSSLNHHSVLGGMTGFTVLPALGVAALLDARQSRAWRITFFVVSLVCVVWFQFRSLNTNLGSPVAKPTLEHTQGRV